MRRGKEYQRHSRSLVENPYVINEFGYVSQESAGFYEKFMSKYRNVEPGGQYLEPPSTREVMELHEKKKPLKPRTPGRRKKVKSKELISDDDEDEENGAQDWKSSEWVRRSEKTGKDGRDTDEKPGDGKEDKSRTKVRGRTKFRRKSSNPTDGPPKRRYIPAPLSFEELLKLAEQKQHEPVIIPGSEYENKRPMTQKEKALYLQKMEKIKKRREDKEMHKLKSSTQLAN